MGSYGMHGGRLPGSFVGREQELAELRVALAGASARGPLFLISGEPGIGKSRLADELAAEAREGGVKVAWGRCWAGGGAPAYWPWIQVLRTCLTCTDPEQPRSMLDSELTSPILDQVAQIVPELRPTSQPPRPSTGELEAEEARFRLFDSVASFVKSIARWQPVLIVIDDLHDADLASLAMLRFVASEVHDANVLIVGTYRDAEMHRSAERLKLIEEALREGNQLPLSGLAKSEVRCIVESRTGQPPSEALVAKLHWLTAGNPLFIDGVVRALAAEGKLARLSDSALTGIKLPDNVRGAIAGRLGMLSEEVRSVLAQAAVIGPEFEVALLAGISELSADSLAGAMDEAGQVGIVGSAGRAGWHFTHPLIREALFKGLKDAARIAAHRRIGQTIEHLHAADLTPHVAQLAHHFREARMVDQAIDYSIRAAEAANAVFAYEEAADQFQAALDLMKKAGVDVERRAGLLERLATVTYSFDEARGVANLEQALKLYEAAGRIDLAGVVHSDLGIRHSAQTSMMDIPKALEHFQKAEAALVEAPSEQSRALLDYAITLACGRRLLVAEGLAASNRAKRLSIALIFRFSAQT